MPALVNRYRKIIYGRGGSYDFLPVLRPCCGAVTVATHIDHFGVNLYRSPDTIKSYQSITRITGFTEGPTA